MEKRFPARPALLALSSKFQLLAVVFLDADDRLSGAGTLAWPCRAGADQRRSSFLEVLVTQRLLTFAQVCHTSVMQYAVFTL